MEEEIVSFKKETDKMLYGVIGYEGEELMAAITGYNLNVSFNMKLINSLADAENCANALADIFYQALIEQLLERKSELIKPEG